MSEETQVVEQTEKVETPTETGKQELTVEQRLELAINNELRFAEETIVRALRSAIQNVVQNVITAQRAQQQ